MLEIVIGVWIAIVILYALFEITMSVFGRR